MHCIFFFFNDTATTEIYTLSLHDALPICSRFHVAGELRVPGDKSISHRALRSEEHTSELQSRQYLVCRLLLEKKKQDLLDGPHDIGDVFGDPFVTVGWDVYLHASRVAEPS